MRVRACVRACVCACVRARVCVADVGQHFSSPQHLVETANMRRKLANMLRQHVGPVCDRRYGKNPYLNTPTKKVHETFERS